MLRTLAIISNQIMLSLVFLIVFLSPKQSMIEGELCIIHGKANGSSFTRRIQALELCSPFPKANQECKEEKERNLTWRNSRWQKLLDTFWVLPRVYFIHIICFFEDLEVRSPTLQTVRKLELKRRSYGCLKTTAQSWAKWAAKISQGVS